MNDKVYTPEVVSENPFPNQNAVVIDSQSQSSSGGNYGPSVTNDKPIPRKRTAVELLSTALNTRSKKILQNFELAQSGGIQVGRYENGVSGDLRITPNGLTARDQAGITTFAIDGDTGEAIFKGQVRAGSILSDTEINGGSININDIFLVDEEGNVIIGIADVLSSISPSFKMYNQEGSLVGELSGDVVTAKYLRWENVALGVTTFYESATTLTNQIARIDVDDGLVMSTDKNITIQGTGITTTAPTNGAVLYVDQSGGKNRLMVKFNTGSAQQVATEP